MLLPCLKELRLLTEPPDKEEPSGDSGGDFDDDRRVLCRERSGDRGVEESLMNACLLIAKRVRATPNWLGDWLADWGSPR